MIQKNFIFISIFLGFHLIECAQYEFSVCKKGEDGKPDHICRKAVECPSAIEGLRKRIFPQMCGFIGNEPVVCCAPTAPTKIQDSISIESQNRFDRPKPHEEDFKAIAIVNKMCKVYKASQYTIEKIPPQLIGEQTRYVKKVDCSQVKTLIVGGVDAEPREFPHMALIGYRQGSKVAWSCGGTLISEEFVLSAAHCAIGESQGPPKWVRLGEFNYKSTKDDAKPQTFEIVQQFIHPKYKDGQGYDDIALFRLNRKVIFSSYIRPLCLYTSPTITDKFATATGWGVIGSGYLQSEKLLKVNISLVQEEKCKRFLGENSKIPHGLDGNKMVCAGEDLGEKDTCQGDSGGPITLKDPAEPCMYVQVGITSFGNQFCGQPNSPGVYTRISYYIPWIVNIVWNNPI